MVRLQITPINSRNRINVPIKLRKALDLAKLHGHHEFQASKGWLNKFHDSYGISCRVFHGEERDVPVALLN